MRSVSANRFLRKTNLRQSAFITDEFPTAQNDAVSLAVRPVPTDFNEPGVKCFSPVTITRSFCTDFWTDFLKLFFDRFFNRFFYRCFARFFRIFFHRFFNKFYGQIFWQIFWQIFLKTFWIFPFY